MPVSHPRDFRSGTVRPRSGKVQRHHNGRTMTTIAVLPNAGGEPGYRAIANGVEATGDTPGRALDALTDRAGPPTGPTLVIVQPATADEFFTADQQRRLADLMTRWRQARDTGRPFPPAEQAELDDLIATELKAAAARAAALLRAVEP